jgi:hypothetical protein
LATVKTGSATRTPAPEMQRGPPRARRAPELQAAAARYSSRSFFATSAATTS